MNGNEVILPSYFSDGYFNLLPGQIKEVELSYPEKQGSKNYSIKAEGYNTDTEILAF